MKHLTKLFIFLILINANFLFSENSNNPLTVKKIILENGFTVLINEDHNQKDVFGIVAVNAGTKYNPKDATGVAHYLEHMLFKGTDKIGTINYEKEKPILDEINKLYDLLSNTKDVSVKKNIQSKINDLSIGDAKYAVPNEFSALIQSIGGTGLNATTYPDYVLYYNFFPPQEIIKWIELYYERFRKPVFRLFQSELETVFEEKNRSFDNTNNNFWREVNKSVYKNHPYGFDTLGETNDLKNPSLTKMYEFYSTYYVANNMSLVISGDVDPEKIIPVIKEKFGKLKSGKIPEKIIYPEDNFKGREVVKKKITHNNTGVLVFKAVNSKHPDKYALTIINYLLSNQNKTGLLDKLHQDNKLNEASSFLGMMLDRGSFEIHFIPKNYSAEFEASEKMILNEIEKIKSGAFSEESLTIAKNNLILNFSGNLENIYNRANYILNMFFENKSWEDILNYSEKIRKITKNDIIKIANQYFSSDYLCFFSESGTPEKDVIPKPDFKPITTALNTQSNYAKEFILLKPEITKPRFVDFNKDVIIKNIKPNADLYYALNDVNNIFRLDIRFSAGKDKFKNIKYLTAQLNEIGTTNLSTEKFKEEMETISCKYNFYFNDDFFSVKITGAEENLEKCLSLINDLLTDPKPDQNKLDFAIENEILYRKDIEYKNTISNAIKEFLIFRKNSDFLDRNNSADLKKINALDLLNDFKNIKKNQMTFFYTGKKGPEEIKKNISEKISINNDLEKTKYSKRKEPIQYKEKTIFFNNQKNALQSKIYFYIKGNSYKLEDLAKINAFNEYLNGSMSSLVFQEIRELRSLAYETYMFYRKPNLFGKSCYLEGYIGTQADKTIDAIEAMINLINNLPQKPERFENIKTKLIINANNSKENFRNLPFFVEEIKNRYGYNGDPNEALAEEYKKITFKDIIDFYNKNIKDKPIAIGITGKKENINIDNLKNIGKVIIANDKELYNN